MLGPFIYGEVCHRRFGTVTVFGRYLGCLRSQFRGSVLLVLTKTIADAFQVTTP